MICLYRLLTMAFSFLLLLSSCSSPEINENIYNERYVVGEIPGHARFEKLTGSEQQLDSMSSDYDKEIDSLVAEDESLDSSSLLTRRSFIHNRSRMILTRISNGNEPAKQGQDADTVSMICSCGVLNDTLYITSGIGFFGGISLTVKLFRDEFSAHYYEYTDDVKPFKTAPEASYKRDITVDSKYQYLVLDKMPSFEPDQSVSGYLSMTSRDFYTTHAGNGLDTNSVKVKMHFTCKTRQIQEEGK